MYLINNTLILFSSQSIIIVKHEGDFVQEVFFEEITMKKFTVLLTLCLIIQLFVSCGAPASDPAPESEAPTGESTETPTETEEEPAEEVVLNVWSGNNYEMGPQGAIEGFMDRNPGVKVEFTHFVNDDAGNAKLDTALLSGEPIDVYFTYSTTKIVNRAEGGMAADLSQFGGDAFIEEHIGTEGVFKVDGKYYSVPTIKEPNVIMLNKDIFEEAGVPIPTEWTIDEFREIAKLVHDPDNGVYGVFPGAEPINIAGNILGADAIYNEDGTASNYDDPAFLYNKLSYDLLYTDGTAFPYEEIIAQQIGWFHHRIFATGQVAMAVYSPWMNGTLKDLENYPHDFVTTFAPMPTPEEGVENTYTMGGINNWLVINPQSENPDVAWSFVQDWLLEGGYSMLEFGKIPVLADHTFPGITEKILGDPEGKIFDAEAFQRVILETPMQFSVATITTAASDLDQIRREENDRLMLNQITFEEYLSNLKTRSDEAIAAALE